MLTVADASAMISAKVPQLPVAVRPLRQLCGAVLAETVCMERDQPPFDRVTMDGIAMNSSGTARRLRIAGVQAAGAAPLTLDQTDSCIEVMTGAELPRGADCVIPVEQLRKQGDHVELMAQALPQAWLNVHRRGSDAAQGQPMLHPGMRLTATEIAVIASAGQAGARVHAMPRIALVSTGDELVEPGEPIQPWQVRRSNSYALHAALTRHGFTQLSDVHLLDDLPVLRERISRLLADNDVLVLSGGVSMGKFDFVPQVLSELGVECLFHTVAQRPGKPLWFGVHGDGKAVFALPGNPVSTMMCLHRYVLPGLLAMMGGKPPREVIALGAGVNGHPELTFFMPVKLVTDTVGITRALPCPTRGSGDFISLLGTDGFVELPPNGGPIATGTVLPLYRW